MIFVWKDLTIRNNGELLSAMESIASRRDALDFMRAYREHTPHADSNFGYFTGYMDRDKGQRLRDWTRVPHPVFGMTPPDDPAELFRMGQRWTERAPGRTFRMDRRMDS